LSCSVESPAFNGAVVEEYACVIAASRDGDGGVSVAEVDGVARLSGGEGVCSTAEFSVSVVSPTTNLTSKQNCARVVSASSDGRGGESIG
jgi:hypothetical protein